MRVTKIRSLILAVVTVFCVSAPAEAQFFIPISTFLKLTLTEGSVGIPAQGVIISVDLMETMGDGREIPRPIGRSWSCNDWTYLRYGIDKVALVQVTCGEGNSPLVWLAVGGTPGFPSWRYRVTVEKDGYLSKELTFQAIHTGGDRTLEETIQMPRWPTILSNIVVGVTPTQIALNFTYEHGADQVAVRNLEALLTFVGKGKTTRFSQEKPVVIAAGTSVPGVRLEYSGLIPIPGSLREAVAQGEELCVLLQIVEQNDLGSVLFSKENCYTTYGPSGQQ